jgi:amidase
MCRCMLADWQSYNADLWHDATIHGTSPRTPGGSSGGSSAALAAGLTGIEAGSDIGSSIRNPAHYCGVFGHKPTYRSRSHHRGHALAGRGHSFRYFGGRTTRAQRRRIWHVALDIMAGPDPDDGGYLKVALPKCQKTSLKQFRVAVKFTDPNERSGRRICRPAPGDGRQACKGRCKGEGSRARRSTPTRLNDMYVRMLRAATSARMPDSEIEDLKKTGACRRARPTCSSRAPSTA